MRREGTTSCATTLRKFAQQIYNLFGDDRNVKDAIYVPKNEWEFWEDKLFFMNFIENNNKKIKEKNDNHTNSMNNDSNYELSMSFFFNIFLFFCLKKKMKKKNKIKK